MSITIKKVERWSAKKKTSKLLNALVSENLDVRISAIKALGTIQEENVMHSLIGLLKDPNASIRITAVEALGTLGNGRSLEFVRQMWVTEQDEETREKARLAIAKIKASSVKTEKM